MPTKTKWHGWLETQQIDRLTAEARRRKVSVAWLIRNAIDAVYPAQARNRAGWK